MSADEYKAAKEASGMTLDAWLKMLDISHDTHKSYSCGRRAVSRRKAKHIQTILKSIN
tara:strand:+ start:9581 stop:9754 length:174 start_codon:yes stop_codon:yes gene_type:complete